MPLCFRVQRKHLYLVGVVLPDPFRKDRGVLEKFRRDPTVGPRPKIWTRYDSLSV